MAAGPETGWGAPRLNGASARLALTPLSQRPLTHPEAPAGSTHRRGHPCRVGGTRGPEACPPRQLWGRQCRPSRPRVTVPGPARVTVTGTLPAASDPHACSQAVFLPETQLHVIPDEPGTQNGAASLEASPLSFLRLWWQRRWTAGQTVLVPFTPDPPLPYRLPALRGHTQGLLGHASHFLLRGGDAAAPAEGVHSPESAALWTGPRGSWPSLQIA